MTKKALCEGINEYAYKRNGVIAYAGNFWLVTDTGVNNYRNDNFPEFFFFFLYF